MRRLTQADARRLALALPDVEEQAHQGTPDFRIRGKIFATVPPRHPGRVVVKVDPTELDLRRKLDPETYSDVWGGRWMAVELARISRDELRDLLLAAHAGVAKPAARSPRGRKQRKRG